MLLGSQALGKEGWCKGKIAQLWVEGRSKYHFKWTPVEMLVGGVRMKVRRKATPG